jgi:hypothetical protein
MEAIANLISAGKAVLGIELGSTRIKAVLIGEDHAPIASGDHTWENRLENGVWTYHLDDVWAGIRDAYANMVADVKQKYGVELTRLAAFGVSAMMHGYLPFDKDGKQLAEFRTWRNTMTAEAAAELTDLLGFNIPQRWSIAHLYQAMLNGEAHVKDIAHLTDSFEQEVHPPAVGMLGNIHDLSIDSLAPEISGNVIIRILRIPGMRNIHCGPDVLRSIGTPELPGIIDCIGYGFRPQ